MLAENDFEERNKLISLYAYIENLRETDLEPGFDKWKWFENWKDRFFLLEIQFPFEKPNDKDNLSEGFDQCVCQDERT